MNTTETVQVFRWLVRDTFRQALASGVLWFMIVVSTAATIVCLTVRPGIDKSDGLELAFGAIRLSADQGMPSAVRALEVHLAGWVADVGGLLLALVWTAGFLPTFLEQAAVSVLLAKPAPRWLLFTGKFVGVLTFVALQAVLFVGGTWLALGVRTGVWDPAYFLCVPVLLLHFAVFFSFSAMLAVVTRSSVACVFGSVLFWAICWGMNFGRHAALVVPELHGLSGALAHTAEFGYWVLPKPLDFQLLLSDGLKSSDSIIQVVSTSKLAEHGAWSPIASVLASVAAGLALVAIAAYDFVSADY